MAFSKGKKHLIGLIVFLLVMTTFFIFILLNIDYFDSVVREAVLKYGLIAIFFFCGAAEMLEQPIGPEVIASIGVLFGLDIFIVFIVAVLGSLVGSFASYQIGKNFLRDSISNSCSVGKYGKYCKFFSKWGNLSLLVASLTPIPYVFFLWLAGAFNMKLKNFLVFGVLPRALRIGFVMLIVELIF